MAADHERSRSFGGRQSHSASPAFIRGRAIDNRVAMFAAGGFEDQIRDFLAARVVLPVSRALWNGSWTA
jgi:hypothetical protein